MDNNDMHLNAEQIQAFLEGQLSADGRERRAFEGHLSSCARCSAEVEAWRTLFADLAELAGRPLPHPSPGFADRVMSAVALPAPAAPPAPQKERSWLASLLAPLIARGPHHLSGDVLQDLADGLLPARRTARAHAHLAACSTCAGELEAWRGVMAALARAPRLSPSASFAEGVIAALAPSARPATVSVARPASPWQRALVLARHRATRMVPRTRRAWAALSGIAVTPAAIFGLVLWVVFSHPTLTPGALASFAMWQISDLATAGWNSLLANGPGLASVAGYDSLMQTLGALMQSPFVLAGGALVYSAVAALALRVLHKNLITHRRHARVSSR